MQLYGRYEKDEFYRGFAYTPLLSRGDMMLGWFYRSGAVSIATTT